MIDSGNSSPRRASAAPRAPKAAAPAAAFVGALAAALVLSVGPLSAPAQAKGPAGFFGVTSSSAATNADLQRMGAARVGVLRQPFGWAGLEPNPGSYNFADTDRVVANAASQGITVRPFIYGTPSWARNCAGVPAAFCDRVTPLRSASGRSRWPALMQALVGRYGPNGTLWSDTTDAHSPPFRPITQWQIWNEPNSSTYLRPKPTPKAYWALLKSAATAIQSVDPGAQILTGGLFGTPPRGLTMWRFLEKLLAIKGAKKTIDAVALHPYSPNVKGIRYQLERGREALGVSGASRKKIYLTELGWGSGSGPSNLYKGLGGQAALLKASFEFALKNKKRYRIGGVDWFSWRDEAAGTGGNCVLCESFGLLGADGSSKPAFGAYVGFTGGQ